MEALMKLLQIVAKLFVSPKKQEEEPPLEPVQPTSYRVTVTALEAREDEEEKENYIIAGTRKIPIKWDKVKLYTEPDGYKVEPSQYRKRTVGKPKMFVLHWDVCLSTKSMVKVLKNRGLSVQFAIDNDGTIYQLMDAKDIAWHARGVNSVSCGVEISNAFYIRYQKWYKKHGFGKRPVKVDTTVHGKKMTPHTGFYPVQLEALKALADAVSRAFNIPLKVPLDKNRNLIKGVHERVAKRKFRGIVGHYHVSTNKSDPASLDIKQLVEDVKNEY